MRSPRSFWGAAALLLALPVAAIYQAVFTTGAETMVHLFLGAGVLLVSSAVFDFKLPGWMQWAGCLASGALAVLFLIQGASEMAANPLLTHVAYQVLGQELEAWLVSLFLLLCVAVLLIDSQGKTRMLGFFAVSVVVCLDLYGHSLAYAGSSLNEAAPGLKGLYLVVPAWFLLESRKPGHRSVRSTL